MNQFRVLIENEVETFQSEVVEENGNETFQGLTQIVTFRFPSKPKLSHKFKIGSFLKTFLKQSRKKPN
jgi:hypothetical protein